MFKKGSKLYGIFNNVCPRCHQGAFFKYPFSFSPRKTIEIHESCSNCGLKYMIEPSFFYGAMYVSYAITVAIFVTVFIIAKVFLGLSILKSFIAILLVSVILTPVNMRISRAIWLNMFVHYNPTKKGSANS